MKANRSKRKSSGTIEKGFCDPAHMPIDPVLKSALGDDRHEFSWAVLLLKSIYNCGRTEAGVFLLGLLRTCGDNWEKRMAIATALYSVQTDACVNLLFDELRQVRNENRTRRYLRELIGVLSSMPPSLVYSGFAKLANDKSITPRMRAKFRAVVEDLDYRLRYGYR